MALMRDLNQYLQKRGDRWHYGRRVPKAYQVFDKRGTVRKSLKTNSLEVARRCRDDLVNADDEYWAAMSQIQDGKLKRTNYTTLNTPMNGGKPQSVGGGYKLTLLLTRLSQLSPSLYRLKQ